MRDALKSHHQRSVTLSTGTSRPVLANPLLSWHRGACALSIREVLDLLEPLSAIKGRLNLIAVEADLAEEDHLDHRADLEGEHNEVAAFRGLLLELGGVMRVVVPRIRIVRSSRTRTCPARP